MVKPLLLGGFLFLEDDFEERAMAQHVELTADEDNVISGEMVTIPCPAEDSQHGPHTFPADWIFGGADGKHPGADPRYVPNVYTYWSADFVKLWQTSAPQCDEHAFDLFTWVRNELHCKPALVTVKRPGEKEIMLRVTYYPDTDEVIDNDVD